MKNERENLKEHLQNKLYTKRSKSHQQKIDKVQTSELENLLKMGLENHETSLFSSLKEESKINFCGRVKNHTMELITGMQGLYQT